MSAPAAVLRAHEVELDAATRANWAAVAAETSNCRAQELSVEFACRPPFLMPGCLLLRLRYRAAKPAEEHSWWFAGETEAVSDLTLWCLAGEGESGEPWITSVGTPRDFRDALEKLPVFRIDADTVADYLRTFADFATSDDALLEATSALLIESPTDLVFWTPLNSLESDLLAGALASRPLSAPEPVKNGFEIQGTALLDDELWRVQLRIYDRDVGGLGERNAQKGEIHLTLLGDKPLLAGLPANYLRALQFKPTQTIGRLGYQPDAEGRERLAEKEALAVISDINRHVLPLIQYEANVGHADDQRYRIYPTRVYRQALPFYGPLGLSLVQIEGCLQSGERVRRDIVWRPGFAASLHTEAAWIHALNEHLRIKHRWSLQSAEDAAGYLKFFCRFTWGEHGPYTVVTTSEHAVHPAADPETALVLPDNARADGGRVLALAEILEQLTEPALVEVAADGSWQLEATVCITGALVRAIFKVSPDGAMEMLAADPLVVWQRRAGQQWRPRLPGYAISAPLGIDAKPVLRAVLAADCAQAMRSDQDDGAARPVEVRNRIICGRLDLRGEAVGPTRFVNCRFRGPVDFGHLVAGGYLELQNCVFENTVNLAESELRGRLQLQNVVVCGERNGAGLHLSDATARSMRLENVCLEAAVLANSIEVAGSLELLSVQSHQHVDIEFGNIGQRLLIGVGRRDLPSCVHAYVDLDYARAHSIAVQGLKALHGLYLRWAYAEQLIEIAGADEQDAEFGYYPSIDGSGYQFVAGADLYGTVVEKNQLEFSHVNIAGDLDLNFVRVGTGVWIEPRAHSAGRNLVRGKLEMSGMEVPQLIRIRRSDVGGEIYLRGSRAGEIRMAGEMQKVPAGEGEPERLVYQPLRVGGELNLEDLRTDNEVYIVGVSGRGSLQMRHAQIGGDVTLAISAGKARERRLLFEDTADQGFLLAEFPGGVNLRKTEVAGDIVLSGLDCGSGMLDLADSRVRRDIEALQVEQVVDLHFMGRPGWATSLYPARGAQQLLSSRRRTTARALRLEGLHCDGNADLSGVQLAEGCTEAGCAGIACAREGCGQRQEDGHVLARGAQVAGLFRTVHDGRSAVIPGCLDLSFSQLGTLEISVDTFPLSSACTKAAGNAVARDSRGEDRAAHPAEACGVILQRSSIGMLAVDANESGYPRPLDLRYAEIRWWEFNRRDGNSGGSRRSEEAEDYISLLSDQRNEPLLQRHTWRAIENNLQNWGHDTAADSVHRAMRRWLRRRPPEKGAWNRVKWLAQRALRGVGDFLTAGVTSPSRLLLIMSLWLALSTWLFSLPGNIGPSEQGYFIRPAELRYVVKHPDPGEWGLGAGFWTALGFHVPVAAFTARDEWEPVNDAPMILHQAPGEMWRIRWPITAEDYGNLVLIAHWVMWPVVIVLASRRFLRRAQQQ